MRRYKAIPNYSDAGKVRHDVMPDTDGQYVLYADHLSEVRKAKIEAMKEYVSLIPEELFEHEMLDLLDEMIEQLQHPADAAGESEVK